MKKLLISTFVAGLVALGAKAQEYNTDATNIVLNGYSAVSYVDLNLAQRGLIAFKSEYNGLKYYFTSTEQKTTFDANPTKYVPQFGGWCATGIAVGAKFRTDPNKFVVQDGKLYVFLNDLEIDAKELWMQDPKGMQGKAEENWPSLKAK